VGDIGTHFPPDDPRWKDADSMTLLAAAVALLRKRGLDPVNVDATIVCEVPRLADHIPRMRASLAEVLETGDDAVSIKGKTNEGMGWVGRGEGIAVIAVALVRPVDAPGRPG
jgi:2-C-methyl-D-erythritol 2,4-cyclodiphosphate synthase